MFKITQVQIETTFREPSDKAVITFPRNWDNFFDKKKNPRKLFPHGTPVEIWLGYDDHTRLVKEFEGYVQTISSTYPIEITSYDEMWNVKRLPVNLSMASITLDKLLKMIAPNYEIDALEGVDLGEVRLAKTNVGAVLAKLQDDFGLMTYMRGKTIVCGKYYAANTGVAAQVIDLDKAKNNELQWRNGDEVIAKIKGTSVIRGVKYEYEAGEEGGDSYDFPYPGVSSYAALKEKVNEDYEKLKQGGFSGELTILGKPSLRHGEKVSLVSRLFPERNGTYYIDSIVKNWNPSGYEQVLTLPIIAA
ncbi:MAG: hypothetical protein M9892_04635 [Bacteroidetes bacterium]|nr:hypothetical protein [Bacteroidota bacterium]